MLRSVVYRIGAMAAVAVAACFQANAQTVQVQFSPGGASDLVLETIKGAKREIDVAAYEFTSGKVAQALIAAHRRGVQVAVLADARRNEGKGYSKVYALAHQGVAVRLNGRYAAQHNKFIVVDGAAVETGSFNYTHAAEADNAENAIVIRDGKLASKYRQEFMRLWQESEPVR